MAVIPSEDPGTAVIPSRASGKINKTAKKKNKRNEYKMNFYIENYSFVW